MALIVVLENLSGLAPVSNYRARVFVNQRLIAGPFVVKNHKREDGWEALVAKFINEPKAKE